MSRLEMACDLRQTPRVFGQFVQCRQGNPMGDCQNGICSSRLVALLGQAIHNRSRGYEVGDAADRFCIYQAMRQVVGGRSLPEKQADSTAKRPIRDRDPQQDHDNIELGFESSSSVSSRGALICLLIAIYCSLARLGSTRNRCDYRRRPTK